MFCPICCEDDLDELLACSYCHFEACHTCTGRYLTQDAVEPSCMSCKKIWSREFVMEKFDKKWIKKEFLPNIGRLLIEKEKMFLPETQAEAATVKKIKDMSYEIQCLPTSEKLQKKYKKDPVLLEAKLEEKRHKRNTIFTEMNLLKKTTLTYGFTLTEEKEKVKYISKCPYGDCRGFVSYNFACGTCSRQICGACYCCKEDNHKCKKEDIESAALIKSDTKQCPKCMTHIFKSSGCSQIFCTQCQTAFDWHTGKIETGLIHNPHYYDWLVQNNELAARVPVANCNEFPQAIHFNRRLRQLDYSQEEIRDIMAVYRKIIHIQEVLIPEYSEDRVKANFDLRVSYLLEEFDENVWKTKLLNREKKRMKLTAFRKLLELVAAIMTDYIHNVNVSDEIIRFDEYKKLKSYYEESIDQILDVHGGTAPANLDVL